MLIGYFKIIILALVFMGVIKIIYDFLSKKKDQYEVSFRELFGENPPVDKDNGRVQVNVRLYQNISNFYRKALIGAERGTDSDFNITKKETKKFFLDNITYFSKEVGEKGFRIIEQIDNKLRNYKRYGKSIPESESRHLRHSLKRSSMEILKLKDQIKNDLINL